MRLYTSEMADASGVVGGVTRGVTGRDTRVHFGQRFFLHAVTPFVLGTTSRCVMSRFGVWGVSCVLRVVRCVRCAACGVMCAV